MVKVILVLLLLSTGAKAQTEITVPNNPYYFDILRHPLVLELHFNKYLAWYYDVQALREDVEMAAKRSQLLMQGQRLRLRYIVPTDFNAPNACPIEDLESLQEVKQKSR